MNLIIDSRALNLSPEVRKAIAAKVREHRALEREYPRRASAREMLELWLHMAQPVTEQPAPLMFDNERDNEQRYERTVEREIHTRRALSDMAAYRHQGPR